VRLAPPRWRFRPSAGSSPRYCRREGQACALALLGTDGAEDVGRSGALIVWGRGLVPRLAQRRVVLFFCPMRASSANRSLLRPDRRPSRARFRPGARGSFFKFLDRPFSLGVMTRTGRQLAIAHRAQLAAQVCLATMTRNSSKTHWHRSTARQRTTP